MLSLHCAYNTDDPRVWSSYIVEFLFIFLIVVLMMGGVESDENM